MHACLSGFASILPINLEFGRIYRGHGPACAKPNRKFHSNFCVVHSLARFDVARFQAAKQRQHVALGVSPRKDPKFGLPSTVSTNDGANPLMPNRIHAFTSLSVRQRRALSLSVEKTPPSEVSSLGRFRLEPCCLGSSR